jgi:hypothetical protein
MVHYGSVRSGAAAGGGADAFLLGCIDYRIGDEIEQFMAERGLTGRYSEMRIAGGGLAAVTDMFPSWGQAVWENLAFAVDQQKVRSLKIVNHRRCGAFNLVFGRDVAADPVEEARLHTAVLAAAAAEAARRHPQLAIETALIDIAGHVEFCSHPHPHSPHSHPHPHSHHHPIAGTPFPAAVPAPQRDRAPLERFRDLVTLKAEQGGSIDRQSEAALLQEASLQFGLPIDEARAILRSVAAARGSIVERDAGGVVEDYLVTELADRRGRVTRDAFERGVKLFRSQMGNQATVGEARSQIREIMTRRGLTPRRSRILQSLRWYFAR